MDRSILKLIWKACSSNCWTELWRCFMFQPKCLLSVTHMTYRKTFIVNREIMIALKQENNPIYFSASQNKLYILLIEGLWGCFFLTRTGTSKFWYFGNYPKELFEYFSVNLFLVPGGHWLWARNVIGVSVCMCIYMQECYQWFMSGPVLWNIISQNTGY